MSADEFDAWMRARQIRVATGKPAPMVANVALVSSSSVAPAVGPAVAAPAVPTAGDVTLQVASFGNEQNALLFGVVYPPIAEAMGYEVEDIHEYMLGRHFGWVDAKVPKTPRNPEGLESRPFRTTTRDENGKRNVLSTVEFSKFLDTGERVAAQAGVFVPMGVAA